MTATKKAIIISAASTLGVAFIVAILFAGYTVLNPIKPVYNAPVAAIEVQPPTVAELLTLVNAERAKVNVAPLVIDEKLNVGAQLKADDMFTNNYFGHVDKNGKQGYEYAIEAEPEKCAYASENITDNIRINDSKSAVNAWVRSPSHYAAMINTSYTITGFGISGTKMVEHFC